MPSTTLAERLLLLAAAKDLTPNAFDKEIGSKSARFGYIQRTNAAPQTDYLQLVCKRFPDINPAWLLLGEGEMYKDVRGSSLSMVRDNTIFVTVDPRGNDIPVYVPIEAQAGYVENRSERFLEKLPPVSIPPQIFRAEDEIRVFEVKGDSMEPTFFERDIVFAARRTNPSTIRNGRVYVIVTKDNGVMLKRVERDLDGTVTLHSDNRFYESFTINPSDIIELWYVRRRWTAQLPPPNLVEGRLAFLESALYTVQIELGKLKKENRRKSSNDDDVVSLG